MRQSTQPPSTSILLLPVQEGFVKRCFELGFDQDQTTALLQHQIDRELNARVPDARLQLVRQIGDGLEQAHGRERQMRKAASLPGFNETAIGLFNLHSDLNRMKDRFDDMKPSILMGRTGALGAGLGTLAGGGGGFLYAIMRNALRDRRDRERTGLVDSTLRGAGAGGLTGLALGTTLASPNVRNKVMDGLIRGTESLYAREMRKRANDAEYLSTLRHLHPAIADNPLGLPTYGAAVGGIGGGMLGGGVGLISSLLRNAVRHKDDRERTSNLYSTLLGAGVGGGVGAMGGAFAGVLGSATLPTWIENKIWEIENA